MRTNLRSDRRKRDARQRSQLATASVKYNRKQRDRLVGPSQYAEQRSTKLTALIKWFPGSQKNLQPKQPELVQLQKAAEPVFAPDHEPSRAADQNKQAQEAAREYPSDFTVSSLVGFAPQ